MIIEKLETREQLENLKPNDLLIVEWKEYSTPHRRGKAITSERMWGINRLGEVITNLKKNYYFSIDNFVNGTSTAKEVYLVREVEDKCQEK